MSDNTVILEVKDLKKHFPIKGGIFGKKVINHVKAVDDVSFSVYKGETLGIVGESGCGKSTTGRTILRLLDPTDGKVIFNGVDLATLSPREMRKQRKNLQIIFQDPFASLNPRMKISKILEEPMKIFNIHRDEGERKKEVLRLLNVVGLNPEHADRFPHEFSGGQRQRIGIARALSVQPKLIIADEPVSALDVSIQSQVLNLMKELQREFDLTYIFISHDLSVVKHLCDRTAVMYLGNLVELSAKKEMYVEPLHPYTKALLSAVPVPKLKKKQERIILQGSVPSPSNPPPGCVFHTRCSECMDICKQEKPQLKEVKDGRLVACHLYK